MTDWKAAIEGGGFVFTRAFDGLASPQQEGEAEVAAQCERVYAAIIDAASGLGARHMVRLDHFTQSQSWLSVRQAVRARYFGRPAPLASTGVPVRMGEGNLLRAAGVAAGGRLEPRVLLTGEAFGMPAISTAVAAGPFIFISGILAQERGAFEDNLAACLDDIGRILGLLGAPADRILRMDAYTPGDSQADVWRAAGKMRLGGEPIVRTLMAAFDAAPIEVNLLLAAPETPVETVPLGEGVILRRAGGLGFVGGGWDAASALSLSGLIQRLPGQAPVVGARVDVAAVGAETDVGRLKEAVLVITPADAALGSETALIFAS